MRATRRLRSPRTSLIERCRPADRKGRVGRSPLRRPFATQCLIYREIRMDGIITASDARVVQRLLGMPASTRQLLAMDRGFSRTGGIACGDEVASMLRKRSDQPISTLARWIVGRTVVSFEWQSRLLLPLFQFDLSDMSPRLGVVDVIRELSDAFDDWEFAS